MSRPITAADGGKLLVLPAGRQVQTDTVDLFGSRTVVTMTIGQAEAYGRMLARAITAARRSK